MTAIKILGFADSRYFALLFGPFGLLGGLAMPVEFKRMQELLGTFGGRIGEESFGIVGPFHNAAIFKQDHLVGDGSRELHFVRHDEHGLAGIGEFEHHVEHFAHHFRIKRGGDLVEQQHFRMQDQRTADGHALALASGQLMRQASLRSASPTRSNRAMASFSTSALSRFCTSVGASVMLPSTVLLGNRS